MRSVDGVVERRQDVGFRTRRVDIDEREIDPAARPQVVERADPAGMLEAGRDGAIARPPLDAPDPDVHPVGRGVGEPDVADVGGQDGRRRGPGLGHPLQRLEVVVDVGATGADLVLGELVHGGCRLGGKGADRACVQVDPGLERRKGGPDGGESVRVGG